MRHTKKQKNMTYTWWGGGGGGRGTPTTQIARESDQMLDLTVNGDFK